MAKSEVISKYKHKITSLIVNNKKIINWINEPNIVDNDKLIYNNIFNYIRIPYSTEDEKVYICLEVDIPEIYSQENPLYGKLVITIYIICHQNLMKTGLGGTRTDLISGEIDKMLTGKKIVGIKNLELVSNIAGSVNDRHRCRVMTFYAEDLSIDCDYYLEDDKT